MEFTKKLSPTTWDYWRIVLALAAKDIVDALKNKTTLTIILGLVLMMLTVQALPLLLKLDDRPRIAIFDAARTTAADELRRERTIQVLEMRSAEAAQDAAREASGPLLAVILPAGWPNAAGPLVLDGYLAHWVPSGKGQSVTTEAQRALGTVTGRTVAIQTTTVYPGLANGGHTIMVALGMILAAVLITTILVPHLILEEKKTHTLDLLRVSPASMNQVLLGKALAGTVYGLAAAAVLLAFNFSLVNLWGLLIPSVLAIILFGVGMGLLVGGLAESEGALQGWVGLLAIAVMFPLVLSFASDNRLPDWLQQLRLWLPTTAAYDLVRLSFGQSASPAEVWPRLAAVLVAVVVVYAAAAWRLQAHES